jgi:hypothetical protein
MGKGDEAALLDRLATELGAEGDLSVRVARAAQLKMLLHAAKYPYADVSGVLLGTGAARELEVSDAVPLFHSLVLAPMVEAGCALADEYCKSAQTPEGTRIVGWYHAPARANCAGVPQAVARITSTLKKRSDATCLVMVDCSKLDDESEPGLQVLLHKADSKSWLPAAKVAFLAPGAGREFTKLLQDEAHLRLADFDSWLQDPKLDWRNKQLLPS